MKANKYSPDSFLPEWMESVPAELKEEAGFKAQFAAAAAVMIHLRSLGGDWRFEPQPVGGWADRIAVDGLLINSTQKVCYAVDFSLEGALSPRGHKTKNPFLVHLRREWFEVRADGVWQLIPNFLNALARAFLPALAKPFPLVKS